VLIVATLAADPPAPSITLAGETAHAGCVTALLALTEQLSATFPANPFTDASVTAAVFPVVAPDVKLSEAGVAAMVNDGVATAPTVTTTTADALAAPLVPMTVTFSVPEVAAVVPIVSTLAAVPPALNAADAGASEHVPATFPLTVDTAHASPTVPAKLFTEATVIASVFPLVAPAISARAETAGVTMKLPSGFTTSDSTGEVAPTKVTSPEYTAVIAYVPATGKLSAAVAAVPAALKATADPSALPFE
jgi:hypothetical protein